MQSPVDEYIVDALIKGEVEGELVRLRVPRQVHLLLWLHYL